MVTEPTTSNFQASWAIDWISATFKGEGITDMLVRDALSFGYKRKQWAIVKANFGYALGMAHPMGHIIYSHPQRPEMGVHLMLGGRALASMNEAGFDQIAALTWILEQGGKISRLDLAIDAMGLPFDPIALAQGPRVHDAPGSARKVKFVGGEDGGKTAYIGSRKSERMVRIYDKGREQRLNDVLWTRIEAELKGESARAAARTLLATPQEERAAFVKGVVKSIFNADDFGFQAVMDAPQMALAIPGRNTEDKTLNWMMNQVAKSMAGLMARRTDIDVWGGFVHMVTQNLKAKGIDPSALGDNETDGAGVEV